MFHHVGLAFEQIFDQQLVQRVFLVLTASGQWRDESGHSVHVRVDGHYFFDLELAVKGLKKRLRLDSSCSRSPRDEMGIVYSNQQSVLVVPQANDARLVVAEQLILVLRIERDGVDESVVNSSRRTRQSGHAVRVAIAQTVDNLATQYAMNVESRPVDAE